MADEEETLNLLNDENACILNEFNAQHQKIQVSVATNRRRKKKALAIINQNVEHVKREQQSTKDKFESNIFPHADIGNQETELMKSDSETSQIRNSIDRKIQSSRSAPSKDRRFLDFPSLYFLPFKFAPIFTPRERREVFKGVIPEAFVDDVAASIKDLESYLDNLRSKLDEVDKRQGVHLPAILKKLNESNDW